MFKSRHLRCSFCGKKDSEVSKLVAGPRVYICDECVAVASRLMEDGTGDEGQREKVETTFWHKLDSRVRRLLRGGKTGAKMGRTAAFTAQRP
jgi:ATP-dependent Clp protease ATP-binding subunit ClpX